MQEVYFQKVGLIARGFSIIVLRALPAVNFLDPCYIFISQPMCLFRQTYWVAYLSFGGASLKFREDLCLGLGFGRST